MRLKYLVSNNKHLAPNRVKVLKGFHILKTFNDIDRAFDIINVPEPPLAGD